MKSQRNRNIRSISRQCSGGRQLRASVPVRCGKPWRRVQPSAVRPGNSPGRLLQGISIWILGTTNEHEWTRMDTNSTVGWGATSEKLAPKNARNRRRTDGTIPIRVNSRPFVVRFLKCRCPAGRCFAVRSTVSITVPRFHDLSAGKAVAFSNRADRAGSALPCWDGLDQQLRGDVEGLGGVADVGGVEGALAGVQKEISIEIPFLREAARWGGRVCR